ncbi:diacylglycerol/lipid kinase family protein [Thermoflexus sp.]|uniref:diacylglycerol/lipid kinase family protein n=1 Tax=Thermoflexus sp. TaxID=1969742 RepID=UPI0025F99ACA|nr:diacylglycerol kinase family protein [Thermoflexus sp.]MDW8065878.1 diacylglycerol kinase family lipid kinase [Anaerolineae bacterium]MCS6963574.1 diacylglycerol kinase family lipid kinase [Thermoflexus sp.]MCS7350895.1 diacylglycerol kinase family lipid kinase [Thermoflexus sp.]MCX7690040.1 diacylglycerol kinase family lipid kinase [Thermoflexus sp.]MDW8180346.1 diacylglycerol kinase family lipid kinase [Anaerolineae bacterium]
MSEHPWWVIVNPVAGNGRTGRRWGGLEARLRVEGIRMEVVFTQEPGHATLLAQQGLEAGFTTIVGVGGDGTLHEILNGLPLENPERMRTIRLGMLPLGTGSDFVRTFGLPRDPIAAALRVREGRACLVDVGQVTCQRAGETITRYFINAAGLGFDGEVADRTNRGIKAFGAIGTYLLYLFLTLILYQNKTVTIRFDGEERSGRMNSVLVCNGRYFGGGMFIAPRAEVDDGWFDVILLGDLGKGEIVRNLHRVYRGTHLDHPKITWQRAKEIHVEAKERMFLQAEGELIGEAPATFRILPRALAFLA